MNYFRIAAACGIVAALWLSACKSSTTSPEQPADLMPLAQGNYWVYVVYQLDSTGQRVGTPTYDSVVVAAAIQLAGRQAYPVHTIHQDGTRDTAYFSKDADGTVWQYTTLSGAAEFGLPDIPPRWIKVIAGGTVSSWPVIDTSLTIQVPGVPIPLSIQLKVTGSKAGTETITISGKSYSAQKFSQNLTATIAGNIGSANGTITDWYVAGIGRAQSRSTLKVVFGGATADQSGSESVLVRYRVQ